MGGKKKKKKARRIRGGGLFFLERDAADQENLQLEKWDVRVFALQEERRETFL